MKVMVKERRWICEAYYVLRNLELILRSDRGVWDEKGVFSEGIEYYLNTINKCFWLTKKENVFCFSI